MSDAELDVRAIRRHFCPPTSRIVTNNAASTQPPVELLDLYRRLAPDYENVHRVHHRVVCLGGVAGDHDAVPSRGSDETGDVGVGRLEPQRRALRAGGTQSAIVTGGHRHSCRTSYAA